MKEIGRFALDTNAVIAYRQNIPTVCQLVNDADLIYLPITVMGELLYGALNSKRVSYNKQAILQFSEYAEIVPIDFVIAELYAKIRLDLKNYGHPIPENDIWIASTCLNLNVALITRDAHFQFIKGLTAFSWESEESDIPMPL